MRLLVPASFIRTNQIWTIPCLSISWGSPLKWKYSFLKGHENTFHSPQHWVFNCYLGVKGKSSWQCLLSHIVSILHRCYLLIVLFSALLAPALKSQLLTVCDSSSCPFNRKDFHTGCTVHLYLLWSPPQLLSESLLSKNHLFSYSSIHKSVMSWMGLFLHFKSPSHSKGSEQMLPNMQPNSCLRVYDTKHQQCICWLHIKTFCDYCGRREISDPASPLPEPQIGAANISSSMKAAFPEFFRIYVYCYSARNDKRMRAEKGIAGQSWKTDIFYGFKIFPNKEHWRRRKEVFWNLYQQRKS